MASSAESLLYQGTSCGVFHKYMYLPGHSFACCFFVLSGCCLARLFFVCLVPENPIRLILGSASSGAMHIMKR